MKVKTETKEKVARTHECVIDTHKKTQQDDDYIPLDEFKRIVSEMSASDLWDLVD